MQTSVLTHEELAQRYTTAFEALSEIAHSYFFRGRLGDAIHVLDTTLHLSEVGEVAQKDRLKLLLLYGKILNVDHLIHREDTDLMFSIILHGPQSPRIPNGRRFRGESGASACSSTSTESFASRSSQARKRPTGPAPAMITS